MKSRLVKGVDYKYLTLPNMTIEITKEDIEHEIETTLKAERLSHRYFVEEEVVEKDSIVELSHNDGEIMVHVGYFYFDETVEHNLLGKKVGDEILVNGKTEKVLSIKKRCLPDLDDDFAKSLMLEGVSTFSDYKTYLENYFLDFYHKEYVLYFAMEIFDLWQEESLWEIDNDEVEALFLKYRGMYPWSEEDEESLVYQKEEFFSMFYMMLSLGEEDECFSKISECEKMMMRAIEPIKAFIEDKVEFSWQKED
ncbi:MAG: hypothetical protein K5675_01560 [Lachnospiraceae bacterium]|nr:hypothetical protein [Lachnospiraceae bacterium]